MGRGGSKDDPKRGKPDSKTEEEIEIARLRNELIKGSQTLVPVPGNKENKVDNEDIDIDSLEKIVNKFVKLPYDKLSVIDPYYQLSEEEADLMSALAVIVIEQYLPKINIGLIALICFVLLNVGLLTEKILVVRGKQKLKGKLPENPVKK